VAIADGVAAAEQSHLGAATAVRYAVQWLDTSLAEPVLETEWTSLVASTAWALVDKAATTFGIDEDPEQAERLMATTLLCAVVESRSDGGAVVHLVTVGDSGAWLVTGDTMIRMLDVKETHDGVTSSAVAGLPRVPSEVQPLVVEMNPGDVLLLGTDGIGDALGDGEGEVGQLLRSLVGNSVPSLIEFAHYLDFSRETFDDDRTLVAVWAEAKAPKPLP
jgi:serine/threonine protein phosphatase PrpC